MRDIDDKFFGLALQIVAELEYEPEHFGLSYWAFDTAASRMLAENYEKRCHEGTVNQFHMEENNG